MEFEQPILFATLGFPGSGKTTFARKFCLDNRVVHLNNDRIHQEIFPNSKFSKEEFEIKFRLMDYFAEEILRSGNSVFYDANSAKLEYRRRLRDLAYRNHAIYLLLWFQISINEAERRIKVRGSSGEDQRYFRKIDPSILHEIRRVEEYPTDEPFVVIDGTAPYKTQLQVLENYFSNK